VSDFTNFRAVYDELTDAVSRARHQFLPDQLKNWFDHLDETPRVSDVIGRLQEGLDFDAWYKGTRNTGGSFVGSASLNWPEGKEKALGMKLLLFRAGANKKLDISEVGYTFIYVGNNINANAQAVIEQVFMPMARELRRYLESELNKPEASAPASDRIVPLDHNRPDYKEAVESLDKLIKTIKEANDYPYADKEQRVAEVSAVRVLMEADKVRTEPLVALLRPLVVQYATRLKDTLIGLAVSATVGAFVYLFGHIFG
jgi:hypothetical protein